MQTVATPPATVQPTTPSIAANDLRRIVADFQAAHPAAGSRVEKGAMIFLSRHVERSESGAWYVQSETDAEVEYILAGDQCTCVDFQRHGDASPCKHQFCRAIYQRAERLEADRGAPVEPPACICQPAHGIQCAAHGNAAARAVDADSPIALELTDAAYAALDALGEPCEMAAVPTVGTITVLPYTPEQQAIADELFGPDPDAA